MQSGLGKPAAGAVDAQWRNSAAPLTVLGLRAALRSGSARARTAWPELTATATATGYQQRPATTHNARTTRVNLGYVRPSLDDSRLE
jgi:hypothetical protein